MARSASEETAISFSCAAIIAIVVSERASDADVNRPAICSVRRVMSPRGAHCCRQRIEIAGDDIKRELRSGRRFGVPSAKAIGPGLSRIGEYGGVNGVEK